MTFCSSRKQRKQEKVHWNRLANIDPSKKHQKLEQNRNLETFTNHQLTQLYQKPPKTRAKCKVVNWHVIQGRQKAFQDATKLEDLPYGIATFV